MSEPIRVDADALRTTTAAIFRGLGLPAGDADVVTDALLEADLLGVSSHGVSNYIRTIYEPGLRGGTIAARPEVATVHETPVSAVLDGGSGMGHVVGRRAMDLAIVGAAALVSLAPDLNRCRTARIALGAVAATPRRAPRAEAVLQGSAMTPEAIDEAAAAAAAGSRPISDLRASAEYRREMTRVLTRRVLTEALRRAQKESGK